jgi:hypothetical protein
MAKEDEIWKVYITALREADKGNKDSLIKFAKN